MAKDRARLLFAAMVGANMLGRATGGADWAAALKKTVKAAAIE
jgi:TetR/AcrR family transcriptional regulator, transcriptional repressor for nem operon